MSAAGVVTVWLMVSAWAAPTEDAERLNALDEAAELQERALTLYDEQRYPEAEALERQVLAIRRDALGPDHLDVATSLNGLAIVLQRQGEHEAARPLYEESLAIRRAALGPNHPKVADSIHNLASALHLLRDYEAAAQMYEESLDIVVETQGPNHLDAASTLDSIAMLRVAQGDYATARGLYDRSLGILRQALGPEDAEVGLNLFKQGLMLEKQRDNAGARRLYEQSLAILQGASGAGPRTVVANLHNLAVVMHRQGDYEAAKPIYERSIAAAREAFGPDHPRVLAIMNNLATLLMEKGEYVAARRLGEQSLAISREAFGPDHPESATGLHNHASLLYALGDHEAARPLYEQSLAIRRRTRAPNDPHTLSNMNNLALVLEVQGEYDDAKLLHKETLAIRRETLGPSHPMVATSLNNLAALLHTQGEPEVARPLYEESLAIQRDVLGPNHPEVATTLNNLASLMDEQGDWDAAQSLYEESLAIRRAALGPVHLKVAISLNNLARLFWDQGEMKEARLYHDEALAIAESRLELLGTLSEREALAYVAKLRPKLDSWLAAYHDPSTAWTHALRFKGTVGAGLRATRATATTDPNVSALAERFAATRRRLANLALSSEPGPNRVERLAALTSEVEALQRELMTASARFHADRVAFEATPTELCRALPEGAALVDFLRFNADEEARYAAFTTVSGTCEPARFDLGPAGPIDEAVGDWRGALADPGAFAKRIDGRGRRLTELLWTPIAAEIGHVDQLLVVPDGPLAAIPFGALPTDDGYLLERVGVIYLDRANDLLLPPEGEPSDALVVGGVDYEAGALRADEAKRGALAAACNDGGFEPLPGTETEAAAFSKRWRRAHKADPRHLSGKQATETAVSAALGGRAVAHLATHGFFATGRCKSALQGEGFDPMLLSGLVLAGANLPLDPLAAEDGILTAAEVAALDLTGTGVVVLSACETGLGEVRSGEGVLGLRRAFAIAGAHSLVMSLWSIDDAATAELMDDFYAYHLRKRRPLDPIDALRQAQLDRLGAQRRLGDIRLQEWAGFVATRSTW